MTPVVDVVFVLVVVVVVEVVLVVSTESEPETILLGIERPGECEEDEMDLIRDSPDFACQGSEDIEEVNNEEGEVLSLDGFLFPCSIIEWLLELE